LLNEVLVENKTKSARAETEQKSGVLNKKSFKNTIAFRSLLRITFRALLQSTCAFRPNKNIEC
jgi:hypothetical protein